MKHGKHYLLICILPISVHSWGYTSPIEDQRTEVVTNDWNLGISLYVGEHTSTNSMIVKNGALVQSSNGFVGYDSNALYNEVTVDGSGTRWENSNLLRIGAYGSHNKISVTNGGAVVNYSYGEIGFHDSASNNWVRVSGAGSVWANASTLRVGYYGRLNTLFITEGGYVDCEDGRIGYQSNACNNVVGVDGSGSVWNQRTELGIGADGSENGLLITDGGIVNTAESGTLGGRAAATGNSALVLGSSSEWNVGSVLRVGWGGRSNRLVVAEGGRISSTTGMIGLNANSSANEVIIDGTGSVWTASSWLKVGQDGAGNSLTITNGGQILSDLGGMGAANYASNNTTVLTGSGSVWSVTQGLNIGNQGNGNILTINGGGTASSSSGNIGKATEAYNNQVVVSGIGSTWSNSADLAVGNAGSRNKLAVMEGGRVVNSLAYIGKTSSASGNRVVVNGAGSLWECATNLYVGGNLDDSSGGNDNSLMITNGGHVINTQGYVGFNFDSFSNLVEVVGAGSVWNNSAELRVGSWGNGNALSIHSGGRVDCSFAAIGAKTSAHGNTVTIKDPGSIWSIASALNVGTQGSQNRLTISNGAQTLSNAGHIGVGINSSNNTAIISDTGSTWTQGGGGFRVSRDGSGNALIITNGGAVLNAAWATIGHNSSASNNRALITGMGSVWRTETSLEVGNQGSQNSLIISDGGRVENGTFSRIGGEATSSSNRVEVSGADSIWQADGGLSVGRFGSGNSLRITGGGHVHNSTTWIGREIGAHNNSAVVQGIGSTWDVTNALVVGRLGSDCSLIITNGGFVQSSDGMVGEQPGSSNNTVVVSGAGSKWDCSGHLDIGGWISTGAGGIGNSVTVSNGAMVSSPMLTIYPLNSFHLLSGGRLEAGGINGDLSVSGTFAPCNSTTNTAINGYLTIEPGGTLEMGIGGYSMGDEYDHLSIRGPTTMAGTLDVVFRNGFSPAFGKFSILDFAGGATGSFDAINLPVLPAGQTWNTDNLYTTGELIILSDPLADINGNGIADGWEMEYFGTPILATDNADSDPLNNYEEYIAGTNPTNGSSFFQITGSAHDGNIFELEWDPSITNRLYSISWSTNLTTGFQSLETGIEYPQNSITIGMNAIGNQYFYQVEVKLKP